MCLATAYNRKDDNRILCQYVSRVDIDGSKITMVDVMGAETVVTGTLVSVDLVKNQVIIDCSED